MINIRDKFINEKYIYVFITILVSFFNFYKSYYFAHILSFDELGEITIIQSFLLIMGMSHLGILNGAFRISSFNKEMDSEITGLILIIVVLVVFIFLCGSIYIYFFQYKNLLNYLYSVIVGAFILLTNYFTNFLLARGKLIILAKINFISSFLAFLLIFIFNKVDFKKALLIISFQPIIYLIFVLFFRNHFAIVLKFNSKLIQSLLKNGIFPYLASLVAMLATQFERFEITKSIGLTGLGMFSIVYLYQTVYQLIPSAVNNIYFPKIINAYVSEINFRKHIIDYYKVIILYQIVVLISMIVLIEPIFLYFLPQHFKNIKLIYISFIGFSILTYSDPLIIAFNAMNKMKYILYAFIIAFLIWAAIYFGYIHISKLNLFGFAYFKMSYSLILFIILIFFLKKIAIREFKN